MKHEIIRLGDGSLLQLKVNSYNICKITYSPFGNCQTFAISKFDGLLPYRDEEIRLIIKDIKDKHVNKPQLIIDVRTTHKIRIEQLFLGSYFIINSDYTNNTGSKMTLFLIRLEL